MKQLMFVYGTLRPGQYNAGRFGPEAEIVARNVVTRGRMRCAFQHGNGGYPYVDFFPDENSLVIGDVIGFNTEDPAYYQIARMEVGAGYTPVHILVPVHIIEQSEDRSKRSKVYKNGEPQYPGEWFMGHYSCIAWHKPRFDDERGPIIPDGDWLKWDADHPEVNEDNFDEDEEA